MKIALVTESFMPDITGTATMTDRLAEHLVERGHQPVVVAPAPAPGHPPVGEALTYPVTWLTSRTNPRSRTLRVALPSPAVATALQSHRPDVVCLLSPFAMGHRAGLAARHLDIPIVAVYLTDPMMISGGRLSATLEQFIWSQLRAVHELADINLAPTPAAARDIQTHGIERVQVWELGFDTWRYRPENRSERLRRALAPDHELIVGYVGRLAVEKQVDLLARTSRLPGVRLVLVGHGPDQVRLRSLIPQAHFTGRRQGAALARLYASFDVFVHPGGYETAGLTILEAQASGCPAIVPGSRGAADMVQPGRTGLVVQADSSAAIADAVAQLAADRELLGQLAVNARTAALVRSWQASGDRLIGHLDAARGRTKQLT
jgi:phosphatidylinositol alpha 1,6-mannosyltransferase